MKNSLKWLIPVGIIISIVLVSYSWFVGINNTCVQLNEDVKTSWGNVESSYQRRSDLIPNIVNSVSGAANFEKGTLTSVIEARAKATSVNIDISKASPEQIEQFQKSQSGLTSALSKLLVSVERYPELKANENFLRLQTELEGTENRIKIARDRYNETVRPYNVYIKKFPNSIVANFLDFKEMPYFKADPGAEKAPTVKFNF